MGKSWAWVAAQINMKQQTLNRQIHKNTYPDINEAKNICTLFGISLEYLVTGKEAEYPGISESAMEIALAADKLNDFGQAAALAAIEGLQKRYPKPEPPKNISPDGSLVTEIEAEYGANGVNFPDDVEYLNWEMIMIPYFGQTAAGNPLDIYKDPDDYLPIARQQLKGSPENYFYLRIRGYSLVNAGINEGDLVVIRRANEAEDGKIMLVRYENASTLKKIVKRNGETYLCWEDETNKQIQVNSEDYEVQGVLAWTMKAPGK